MQYVVGGYENSETDMQADTDRTGSHSDGCVTPNLCRAVLCHWGALHCLSRLTDMHSVLN